MPFDPSKPFDVLEPETDSSDTSAKSDSPGFDPSRPFEVIPAEPAAPEATLNPNEQGGVNIPLSAGGLPVANPREPIPAAYDAAGRVLSGATREVANLPINLINTFARATGHPRLTVTPFAEETPAGPLKPLAKTAGETMELATRGTSLGGIPNPPSDFSRGIGQATEKTAEGLLTPESIASLPFLEFKAGRLLMFGQMLAGTPDQMRRTYQTVTDPDVSNEQKWAALGQAGINLAMTASLGLHLGVEELRRSHSPQQVSEQLKEKGTSNAPTQPQDAQQKQEPPPGGLPAQPGQPPVRPAEEQTQAGTPQRSGQGEEKGQQVLDAEALLKTPDKAVPFATLLQLPVDEANKLFEAKRTEGRDKGFGAFQPSKQGVMTGLTMTKADLSKVEAQIQVEKQNAQKAAESGDNAAFKAAFGKQSWLYGVVEGINREGPNYRGFQESAKEANAAAAGPTTEQKSTPPPQPSLEESAKALGFTKDARGNHQIQIGQGRAIVDLSNPDHINLGVLSAGPQSARGQGTGTALLDKVKQLSGNSGKPVTLEARPAAGGDPAALNRFYEQRSFVKIGDGQNGPLYQYTPEVLPAIRRMGGAVVIATPKELTHNDIIATHGLKAEDVDQRGFVGPKGWMDRETTAQTTGLPTQVEPGRQHATDLPRANEPTYRERANALADKLERLKLSGQLSDISGIGSTIWNGSINLAQGILRAGGSVADAIAAAIDHIKANHKGDVDEEGIRAKLNAAFNEGETTPPSTPEPPKAEPSGAPKLPGAGPAERLREEREKAGVGPHVEPGEGIAAADSVERGRQLLNSGADPEAALANFEKTKRFSSDDMALVRAESERRYKAAVDAERQFGRESEQYKTARQSFDDWERRSKVMQTEWNKAGMAQQGETDVDTGSFTGLSQAFKDATGKEFTPEQADKAEQTAKEVKKAQDDADIAERDLSKHLSKKPDIAGAEKKALDAANKAVAKLAIQKAEAETKARVATAERARQVAEIERKRVQKALDAANKSAAEAAIKLADAERKFRESPELKVWERAKIYIDQGVDRFDEVVSKVATDLGMKRQQVINLMARDKKTKRLANDLWAKQDAVNRLKGRAKAWLRDQAVPGYLRALRSIPRAAFALKVGLHGFVGLGTHAPMVAFQPRFWSTYFNNFARMYRMVGSPAYYEMQMQNLLRDPNYIRARRAGLQNDPSVYEDYNSPEMMSSLGRLTRAGNRGYSVLKVLRQDMFNQHWNRLPKTLQIPEVAQAIADGVNHATGVTKAAAPRGLNNILFAPRLEGSRAAWLAVDPVKSLNTFANWKDASLGDRQFALNQVKEKAWVAGTMFGLLALNQGILSAIGSRQKVNMTDPMKSDWMKFKVAGMTVSYGNAMLTMARLPARLWRIRESSGGKTRSLIYPDESTWTVLGEYGRSQLHPLASLGTDLWLKADWQNRQLPNSNRPMPMRLRRQGVQRYTWPEFWSERVAFIPAEEALREVWGKGMGMNESQMRRTEKAMATIAVMSATGARLSDDNNLKPAPRFDPTQPFEVVK